MSDVQIAISIFFAFLCGHLSGFVAAVWFFKQLQGYERAAKQKAAADVQGSQHDENDQPVWSVPKLPANGFGANSIFHQGSSRANFDSDSKPN
jgi:hypothetical protein